MATLDNAIWFGTDGYAESGSTTISDGGNSTTITASFTNDAFDASQSGYAISDFGAFGVTSPITADYEFSNPVEDLSLTFEHVNGSGTTYDDAWTIYAFDENGSLLPSATVIAGISGIVDDRITVMPDGSVRIDSQGTTANDIDLNLAGPIGQLTLVFDNGPEGAQTGGSGISDITFTIPPEPDYIVEGTGGADTVDASYLGDPEGDRVDNLDHSDGSNADSIEAYGGNDNINSGAGADTIDAGTGNDSVLAGTQNDSVIAGDGDDTVFGQGGSDTLLGGAGNDSLDGDGGSDSLDGGAGNDTLIGDGGNDTLSGGADDDQIYVSSGNNLIQGGSGNDLAFGGTGSDTLDGGTGNDTMSGGAGEDSFIDSAGDDSLSGGSEKDNFDYTTITGNDTVVGGEINDTTPTDSGDKLDAHDNVDDLTVVFTGDEAGTMTDGTDTVTFSEIEHIMGGLGTDSIDASASSVQQILDGGEGSDTITGGSGDDIIAMGMTQDFSATDGDDDVLVLEDGFGDDSIEGFEVPTDLGGGTYAGNDQLDVTGLTDAGGNPVNVDDVTVTDTNGDGTGDAILQFPNGESITLWGVPTSAVSTDAQLIAMGIPAAAPPLDYIVEGTAGDDTIDASYLGDPDGDQIDNLDHSDSSNNDSVEAYGGNDVVTSGAGDDTVWAGDGNDTVDGGADSDLLYGQDGADSILGGAGDDTLEGGVGNDTLIGGDGADSINGDAGNDSIVGGAGDDFLRGSFGEDTVVGGTGNDTLWGGFGDDSLVVDANFGDYVVDGEADAETNGDTMDVSAVTDALSWDLSNADPEIGSFTDGTNTVSYTDIENIILGSGTDTLVLDTFGGSDRVVGFDAPTDTGGGTFSGNDLLDVSGLTDFDGNPTHTGNVTVADDGSGNAVLTFPNGETLTLVGVPVADVSTPAQLIAMGIPEGPDGYVDGTAGDDTIGVGYTGDPNFDQIDNSDAVLPGAAPEDDYVRAGAGNDSVSSNAGDDTVELDSGNDTADGGIGDDTIDGGTGDDSIIGGLGNDSLTGGADDDTLNGQLGDDTMEGGAGSDTFALEDDYGNDVIIGGEVDDAVGDTLDLSGLGGGHTFDLTGVDSESGTVTDGTSTITFSEIENIELSAGIDTIVLDNGSGDDTVNGFTAPFDDGFGTWVGIDQVDVSTMIDGNGAPVNTGDVTVTDDGSGNAVLNFPGGETLTLIGVPPTAFPVPEALAAIGIPLADYIVEGTAAGELIDGSYLGDPEGDIVDAGDGDPLLPDADDDSIEAGGGADTVRAGAGDDTVYGGTGGDQIDGDAGNDLLIGEEGNDLFFGGAGDDTVLGGDGADIINGMTGDDSLEGGADADTFIVEDAFGADTIVGGETTTTGTDEDTLSVNGASLTDPVTVTYSGDEAGTLSAGGDTLEFSEIEVLELGDSDDTVNAAADTVGIDVDAGGGADVVAGGTGSDTIDGGAGDDVLSGGEDGDSITAGAGDDTINVAQGDTVTGGDGDDFFNIVDLGEIDTDTITITGGEGGETDGDTLALNGLHDRDSLVITDPDDVNGGLSGTVTLLDGTVVNFTNIENIICFVAGTDIATPYGARKIEDLRVGDRVVTQDNGVQAIRWIGTSRVPATDRFAPVRFAASAFPGASGDLIVSPQHRMLFKGYEAELLFGESEVLIPALHLVDGHAVTREPQDEVTYIHIMFEQHEIVFAQGVATESFHPGAFGVDCLAPQTRDELFSLFPELRSDLHHYGPSARTVLRSNEARLLQAY